MRRIIPILVFLMVCAACSDDDSPTPPVDDPDVVTVILRDTAGDPVPGVLMGLASDNPYLQDAKGEKAATRIEAAIPVRCRVQFAIVDIEAVIVRWIVNGEWLPGFYTVTWDGTDDDGVRRNSGRYTAAMRAYDIDTDEKLFDDSVDMLMCLLDPVRQHAGVTDEEGKIVLLDWTLFPQLYERDPMTAYDETGEAIGALQPTDTMIFTFADTVNGGGMTFKREVSGPANLEFQWQAPQLPVVMRHDGPAPVPNPVSKEDPRMPPGPVEGFSLGPVYPNPFN